MTVGIFTFSCSNSKIQNTQLNGTEDTQKKSENNIIGTWTIQNVEHIQEFDINMDMSNISFFGAETWESSVGKSFTFNENNSVETDLFIRQGKPINLIYQYDNIEQINFYLDSSNLDKTFSGIIDLQENKMSLILDNFLEVKFQNGN